MTPETMAGTQVGQQSNIDWFNENLAYMQAQEELPHYRYITMMVNRELEGAGHVLDVGNGGFFNYDTRLARHVTALDLFLTDGPGPAPNTTFRRGSALDMPFEAGTFDYAVMQNVLHHVTGPTVRESRRNMARAIAEVFRCLKPGARALFVESTVGPYFFAFERLAYPVLLRVKRGGHPVTLQYTPDQILRATEDAGFRLLEYTDLPSRGMLILQFGHKWPMALTPARPIKLLLSKPA